MTVTSLSESFIGEVVLFQTVMLLSGTVATVVFLLLRNAWHRYKNRKKDIFTEEIINLLFERRSAVKKNLFAWDRAIYREILLSQIKVLVGVERDVMIKHYIDSGFLADDSVQVRSRYWWRRLRALIRIDILAQNDSRLIYLKAINDHNLLVALEATRALSRLPQNVSPAVLFASLERVALTRRTALLEVINNIGTHYSVEAICDYLKNCTSEEMAEACVQVLGDLRAYQAIPLLEEILLKHEKHSPLLVVKVLDALSLISDPAVIPLMRPLLKHQSAQVRARSLNALALLGDDQIYNELESLKKSDNDVEIQRVIQKIQKSAA